MKKDTVYFPKDEKEKDEMQKDTVYFPKDEKEKDEMKKDTVYFLKDERKNKNKYVRKLSAKLIKKFLFKTIFAICLYLFHISVSIESCLKIYNEFFKIIYLFFNARFLC